MAKPEETPYRQRALELAAATDEVREHLPELRSWIDLDPETFARLAPSLGETTRKRVQYVVEETARVAEAVAALQSDDLEAATKRLGRLMLDAHRGLSEELEVSTPEIDSLVDLAISKPSILGACLQGAGWGGRVAVLQKDATG